MTSEPETPRVILAGDLIADLTSQAQRERLMALALDAVDSPNTKRNYRIALDEFLDWWEG